MDTSLASKKSFIKQKPGKKSRNFEVQLGCQNVLLLGIIDISVVYIFFLQKL
jgi:hypothetical protein